MRAAGESTRFLGMAHSALSGAGTGELGELRISPVGFDSPVIKIRQVRASPGYVAVTYGGQYSASWQKSGSSKAK